MRRRRTSALASVIARPYWRERDARVVVEALTASGQSLTGFCRSHRVSARRVARWRSKLGVERGESITFVEVDVVDAEREAPRVGGVGEVQVVLRNARRLAVQAGFDGELLAEVARCVERWPC